MQDRASKSYLRRRSRRGWGRIALVTGGLLLGLLLASGHLAYGSAPTRFDQVVVQPGESVWSIAQSRYHGDPRTHVDAVLRANHLSSPLVFPGESLLLPRE